MPTRRAKLLVLRVCVEMHPRKGGVCPLCGEPFARIDGTHASVYADSSGIKARYTTACL